MLAMSILFRLCQSHEADTWSNGDKWRSCNNCKAITEQVRQHMLRLIPEIVQIHEVKVHICAISSMLFHRSGEPMCNIFLSGDPGAAEAVLEDFFIQLWYHRLKVDEVCTKSADGPCRDDVG